jgi:pyruvate,water dikinase
MRVVISLDAGEDLSGTEFGFKAARLGGMVRLGLPVPAGCVIGVAAFREFCAANGIRPGELPAERCKELIRSGSIPPTLLTELKECLTALPAGKYAVRSSAVAEDGRSFSMAGQLDSFLNVRFKDIPERVKDCWIAMLGPAVTAYARKNRVSHKHDMGVIVQQQINARYAGILFTLDPVTRSADHLVIEWVQGLGDQLVSGAVTPERVHLNRHHPVIPKWLPEDLRHALAQLAKHAIRAERHFNFPIDIEWCSDCSEVFLLQARPITAVGKHDAVVWTNTNMSENFPRPLTPFAWSVVDKFYTHYMLNLAGMLGVHDPRLRKRKSPVNRLTGIQCGYVYYNIKSWYRLLRIYLPAFDGAFRGYLDHYIGQSVPVDLDSADTAPWGGRGVTGILRHISFWSRLAFCVANGRYFLNRFERLFSVFRHRLRRPPYRTLTAGALVGKLDELFEDFVARHWYHQCIADFSVLLFPGILHSLVARWVPGRFGDPAMVSARLMQHRDMASTDSARIIARMAQAIREDRALARLLDHGNFGALEAGLPVPLRALFDDFMDRFGSRCYHECMIVSPTFEERHDLFWELVSKSRISEAPQNRNLSDTRDTETDYLDNVLRALPVTRRHVIAWIAKRARSAIALREQGRMVQSMLFGEIRRLAVCLGENLNRIHHLSAADDVFYLRLSELRDLCYGKFLLPETVPKLIAMRRKALERCDEVEPPECFVLDQGEYWKEHTPVPPLMDDGVLRGTCASRGKVTGTARVMFDPVADHRLQPGDILVARSTDPGWTPLFMIAGGLVLERGGMLSHGAIVAREFGIPVVVGVTGATKQIPDGARVCVNGDAASVIVLDQAPADLDENSRCEAVDVMG